MEFPSKKPQFSIGDLVDIKSDRFSVWLCFSGIVSQVFVSDEGESLFVYRIDPINNGRCILVFENELKLWPPQLQQENSTK